MTATVSHILATTPRSWVISSSEVLVDTQTGVQYLYHAVGNSGGLTLLVDAEGKPLLYHKTPDAPEF